MLMSIQTEESVTYNFTLEGRVVPKATPRHNGKRAYLPLRYREWKEDAIAQLHSQCGLFPPIEKSAVNIEIYGSSIGDSDNISGAILDALVQSFIILDDRLSCVPKLSLEYFPSKSKYAVVNITTL